MRVKDHKKYDYLNMKNGSHETPFLGTKAPLLPPSTYQSSIIGRVDEVGLKCEDNVAVIS